MEETPRGNRIQIGIFGRCNVGKSSLLNALTDQDLAVVSSVKGTTTDPVRKAMELLPLGPVILVDTPGLDDTSLVGKLRIEKTMQTIRNSHIAVLVLEYHTQLYPEEKELLDLLKEKNLPVLLVQNKTDETNQRHPLGEMFVSAVTREGIEELKEKLATLKPKEKEVSLLQGIVQEKELILLVMPIDQGAPKGRIILPQQQTLRGILDIHSGALVLQPEEIPWILSCLTDPPALVITDSQVFGQVAEVLPESIPLTSFSILFARFKGLLKDAVKGIESLKMLEDGSQVLIAEGCSHHRQCEDLGTVKIPQWISEETQKKLDFVFSSGGEYPKNMDEIDFIVHCGGCMLNDKEMAYRLEVAKEHNIPITNYGILIAHIQGTLSRSIALFQQELE